MPPVRNTRASETKALTSKKDNTNACHLELYTVLGEYDNAGFPLSKCLLSTASSIEDRKRTKALMAWAATLRGEYSIVLRFVHMDKDMAEIGASHSVWPDTKHQLCWWHQREAVKKRLKGNLPTSAYNAKRANEEYAFINIAFKPSNRVDPTDSEGGVPGESCEQGIQGEDINLMAPVGKGPNSIKIRILMTHLTGSSQTGQSVGDSGGWPTLTGGDAVNNTKLTIRIPTSLVIHNLGPENEPEPDEDITGRRTFCPMELWDNVIEMMERHFCVHPLIPRYSAPSAEGIKDWAVKQIYELCFQNNLPNLWAYLWENWYWRGRWELWARSGNPDEIPCLKMTMLVEGQ